MTSSPRHHPHEEHLLDYAFGNASQGTGLLVAAHLALCPDCRQARADAETLAGILLAGEDEAPECRHLLAPTLARLGAIEPAPRPATAALDARLPSPLWPHLGAGLESLAWRSVLPGIREAVLLPEAAGEEVRLIRVREGQGLPRHTHDGNELTLVLGGGFSDGRAHYGRGDVAIADPAIDHRPIADPGEECLCLSVTDAPLRLTGPFGRLMRLIGR